MKCTCGCEHFNLEITNTHKGLYCENCGKWIKWIGKQEFNALRFSKFVRVHDSRS